ncbi:MAG: protein kinase, partial [Deltaproteobacteria bacterium]|nr:protein kinase [Deltaproteobacteria bacterium]
MHELPATFGKYYLTEKLATGGMAEIYLGKILGPAGFEKQLVIKQIHPRLTGQRHFVDLFVAEAKTLVGLAHGNIVPVYELGVVDDIYYIAMEYIDGPTLYRLTESVARGGRRLGPTLAAWIAAEILDGLDYAHRKGLGVIHRDLSPRNVMLSRDGEVKLVDFGIAVGFSDGGAAEAGGDGAPTGSFPYMSPEQVRRERLTGQSDLFSVAVLLWEMLTGRRLFARASADQTLAAVTDEPIVAPSTLAPEVPAALDAAVLRGLEREREGRWATAAEFHHALNRFLYSQEPLPSARDLADAVARYCPPERIADAGATAVEVHTTSADEPGTAAIAREPRTAAISRPPVGDGAPFTAPGGLGPTPVNARGKRRATTTREQSFATNVAFQRVLERATPLFPMAAIRDLPDGEEEAGEYEPDPEPGPDPDLAPGRDQAPGQDQGQAPQRPTRLPAPAEVTARTARGSSGAIADVTAPIAREPRPGSPRWGAWLVVAIAAAAIAAIVWWVRQREAPVHGFAQDAGAGVAIAPDASLVDAAEIAPPVAASADAGAIDTIDAAAPLAIADARRADPVPTADAAP